MSAQISLALLPGLDGTDVFFRRLVAALPEWISPIVVQFPTHDSSAYGDLLPLVRGALARTPECYVLGWSFSGPLALMLAEAEPDKIRGVILVSSFVSPPRPAYARLRWGAVTPMVWMLRACRRIPVWLSRGPADQLRLDKAETWRRVSARTVAGRIRAVLKVDARDLLRRCSQPVLCLAGADDGVVPRRNVEKMRQVRPSLEVRVIDGRHFALYTNSTAAADVIARFMVGADRGAAGAGVGRPSGGATFATE